LILQNLPDDSEYFFSDFLPLSPLEQKTVWLYFKTGKKVGKFKPTLAINQESQAICNQIDWDLELVPQISVNLAVNLLFKRETSGDNFKFVIYNAKDEVVFEAPNVKIGKGEGQVSGINNLFIGERYRLVITKPLYLPRQEFLKLVEGTNEITFEPMIPLDFNSDGRFTLEDIVTLFKQPKLMKVW
jgi:hypothetical protein